MKTTCIFKQSGLLYKEIGISHYIDHIPACDLEDAKRLDQILERPQLNTGLLLKVNRTAGSLENGQNSHLANNIVDINYSGNNQV